MKLFLKLYILRLFTHAYNMVLRHDMEHIKIIPRKSSFSRAVCAKNNLAYNEHTNAYFKRNKILKHFNQYKHQVLNNIFQLPH